MIEWGLPQYVVVAVAALRIAELIHAERNRRGLIAAGGREVGAGHYPLFVVLHAGWLLALFLFVPADVPVASLWLWVFVGLQAARLWVIASLGRYWTTRIVTLPGRPLVTRGPYTVMRHPNYAIALLEFVVLPLAFGAYLILLLFLIPKALLIVHRIRVEDRALADRRVR